MALVEGITRRQLTAAAIAVLQAAGTSADARIYEPRDWPSSTDQDQFPMLIVQVPAERKQALQAPGLPQFDTTMNLVVVARAIGTDPTAVNLQLDTLSEEVESALLGSATFLAPIQRTAGIAMKKVVTADGRQHIGEFGLQFDFEIFQIYGPNEGVSLTDVQATITNMTSGITLTIADATL